jgi:hypothetical protein
MDDLQQELQETIQERSLLYTRVNLLDKKIRDLELKIRLVNMAEVKSSVKTMLDVWEGSQATIQPPAKLEVIEEHIPLKDLPIKKEDPAPLPAPTGWFSFWGTSPPPAAAAADKIADDYVQVKADK